MSARRAFRIRCYANGVTDPGEIADLWAEEVAKRKQSEQKGRR